jgi:hypothetical protein
MLAAADSACRLRRRHPEETRVVNTLATTADIAWLQGLLSRDFNLKFN